MNPFGRLLTLGMLVVALLLPASPVLPAAGWDKVSDWVWQNTAGEGRTDFLVILVEGADISAASRLPSRPARGAYVHQALVETAERSQAPLRAWLEARGVPYRPFYIVNLIHVLEGDRALVEALAARPEVARIEANPRVRNLAPQAWMEPTETSPQSIEWNILQVNADQVWAMDLHGQNLVVGGQDTGYDWDHPALINQYRGWDGLAVDHDYHWHDAVDGSPVPLDPYGHGTHTMGTAVGDDSAGNQVGMAPGAQWIGCRNMDANGYGTPARYLDCFEFFLAPYPLGGDPFSDGDPNLAPHVTVNSWTCPASEGCSWFTLQEAVEVHRAAGIMTVASAGNGGSQGCSSVAVPPAIYDAAYTIGATGANDDLAGFSSRGPVVVDGSGRLKPDIVAPGLGVRSAAVGGGYTFMSGTSMAAPHVAGAVALLWSAVPGLTRDIAATENYLNAAALHIPSDACSSSGVPNNLYGWGRLDIFAAVQAALAEAGYLTGRVTEAAGLDAPGDPVPGAQIWASRSPTITVGLLTDAAGYYGAHMVSGTFSLTVAASGYLSRTISEVVVASGLTTTLDIVLSSTCVISGDFWHRPLEPIAGENVIFTGTLLAGAPPVTYTWDFGDATGPQVGNPITHAFTQPDLYLVTMMMENLCPDPTVVQRPVLIGSPPSTYLPLLFRTR